MTRIAFALIVVSACAKQSTPDQPRNASRVFEQIFVASVATDGSCVAVPVCEDVREGVPCSASDPTGVVRFAATSCLAGASTWRVGLQLASTNSCTLLDVTCTGGGSTCAPANRNVSCPEWAMAPTQASEPPAPDRASVFEPSTLARKNVELGYQALAAGHLDVAAKYFQFTIEKFPDSTVRADAESGLQQVAAKKSSANTPL